MSGRAGAIAAQFLAGPAERRTYAILRHVHDRADFAITFAFDVIQPYDLRFVPFEIFQQSLDFVTIDDAVFVVAIIAGRKSGRDDSATMPSIAADLLASKCLTTIRRAMTVR